MPPAEKKNNQVQKKWNCHVWIWWIVSKYFKWAKLKISQRLNPYPTLGDFLDSSKRLINERIRSNKRKEVKFPSLSSSFIIFVVGSMNRLLMNKWMNEWMAEHCMQTVKPRFCSQHPENLLIAADLWCSVLLCNVAEGSPPPFFKGHWVI